VAHAEPTPFAVCHNGKNGTDNEQNGKDEPLERPGTAVGTGTENDFNPVSRYESETEQHPTHGITERYDSKPALAMSSHAVSLAAQFPCGS
jgi:hypothetical protein